LKIRVPPIKINKVTLKFFTAAKILHRAVSIGTDN
jgi:hypothetical protein